MRKIREIYYVDKEARSIYSDGFKYILEDGAVVYTTSSDPVADEVVSAPVDDESTRTNRTFTETLLDIDNAYTEVLSIIDSCTERNTFNREYFAKPFKRWYARQMDLKVAK